MKIAGLRWLSARIPFGKNVDQNDHLMARYAEGEVKYEGYLDDYAALTDALIALYEATWTNRCLTAPVHGPTG